MDPYLFPRQIVGRQQTSNKPDVDFEHGNFSVLQEPKQRNKRQTRTVAGFTGFNARESDERNAPSLKSHRSFGAGLDRRWRVRVLVFLNSTTAQKSYSFQLTELQTVYILPENVFSFCSFTRFIIYAPQCKLLQNKLNWSRKVTRTAVTSVAAAGSRN